MSHLRSQYERVGHEYDHNREELRLESTDPIEYAITARYLDRYVPDGSVVADVGVGGGQYSLLLAQRGCQVHLVDVSQHLLHVVASRLSEHALAECIRSVTRASATDLAHLTDESCDVTLMLGPLYHLLTVQERWQAVREAARILRPRGLIVAAGINRLTYLRDVLATDPEEFARRPEYFSQQLLADGNLRGPDGHLATMHVTTVAELRAELSVAFEEVVLVGVESFASKQVGAKAYCAASLAGQAALLDLIERTGRTPEGLGITSHYLYIGRKSAAQTR